MQNYLIHERSKANFMSLRFFTAPGQFYRGNLHTHSTRSDGVLPPEEVCRRYQDEGYDFIALTDHFVGLYDYPITDTTSCRNEAFTTILGAELHTGAMEKGNIWHILAVGLPSDFEHANAPHFMSVEGSETGAELSLRARDAGAFVAIAHPHWSHMTEADARSIKAAHAVEIYNHGCAVDCDRGEGFVALEQLLHEGVRFNMIATDDAHFETNDYFGGWVMVKATENSPEALLTALKAGAFYSSLGPEIHDIRIVNNAVEIECSPVSTMIVQAEGTNVEILNGDEITKGKLPLSRLGASPWIRVSIIDSSGKRAWSNPIWIDG